MLNKHNLEIAKFCTTDSIRFALGVVHVTPDCTVATNGNVLVKVTTPTVDVTTFPVVAGTSPATRDFKPFLLYAADALRIAKALPRKQTIPVLENAAVSAATNETHAVILTTDLQCGQTFTARKAGGTFPDCERVIPNPDKADYTLNFDAALLKSVCEQVMRFVGKPTRCRLRLYNTAGQPLRIDAYNPDTEQLLTALVMARSGDRVDPVETYNETIRTHPKS